MHKCSSWYSCSTFGKRQDYTAALHMNDATPSRLLITDRGIVWKAKVQTLNAHKWGMGKIGKKSQKWQENDLMADENLWKWVFSAQSSLSRKNGE